MTSSEAREGGIPAPLYRRIRDELRAGIGAGEYRPGDRLPSELQLARTYNVSRITSHQALDLLGPEGLPIRCQGMGSFVRADRVQCHLTLGRTAPGKRSIQSFTPVFADKPEP